MGGRRGLESKGGARRGQKEKVNFLLSFSGHPE